MQRAIALPFPNAQSQLWLTEVKSANRGGIFPRSYLMSYTIGVRLSGQRSTLYRNQRFTTGGGSFIIYQPGEVLASRFVDHEPWHHWSLNLSPQQFEVLLHRYFEIGTTIYFPEMLAGEKVNFGLAQAFMQLVSSTVDSAGSLETESLLLAVLRLTIQHMAEIKPVQVIPKRELQKVEQVKAFIQDNLGKVISFSELSALTEMSPDYLSRVFKREVGASLYVYQTCLRLRLAKDLLLKGLPILDVALQTGFSDQSHFQRVFKKYNALTPSQFVALYEQ